MRINWLVRIKNKTFWVALIPVVLLLIQEAAALFGYVLDFGTLDDRLINIVELVFMALGILGIVADPTTEGLSDSNQALTYTEPKKAGE